MKICYLSSILNIHDYRFLSQIVKRGYEVYLVAYIPKDRFLEIPKQIAGIEGLKVIHKRYNYFQKHPYLIPIMVSDFRRVIDEIKPDILHCGYVLRDGFLAALSGFHPILLMPWGSDILIEPMKSILRRSITKYAINRANFITCDCEIVKRKIIELSNYDEKKILVFPWGVELDLFKPDSNKAENIRNALGWKDNKIIIMNRNFEHVYGCKYLLQALPKIIREEPGSRIIMIGQGSLEGGFRRFVKEKSLGEYVKFPGAIRNKEMPGYLNAADIYVSTSLSDGTSISLLEGMACGLPVVVTEMPSNKEWVINGKNGFLVPMKDHEGISNSILTLLRDDNLRLRMGMMNRRIVEDRANWSGNVDKLENIYKILASNSGRA